MHFVCDKYFECLRDKLSAIEGHQTFCMTKFFVYFLKNFEFRKISVAFQHPDCPEMQKTVLISTNPSIQTGVTWFLSSTFQSKTFYQHENKLLVF